MSFVHPALTIVDSDIQMMQSSTNLAENYLFVDGHLVS
jgi:hypothetical protein